jgi:hypothetical protein
MGGARRRHNARELVTLLCERFEVEPDAAGLIELASESD